MVPQLNSYLAAMRPGTIVKVSHGLYDHVGLLTEYTQPPQERHVLSLTGRTGGLVDEPISLFAGNKPVFEVDYPSDLPPEWVLMRARSLANQRYSLFSFNCEHFVNYAHGLPSKSPQIAAWLGVAAIVTGFVVLAR